MRETPESHWHTQYTALGKKYPIMRNHLAVKIKPTMFRDKIETDIITRAVEEGDFSNLHAWCENGDGNMLISNSLLPLKSARRYCQERNASLWIPRPDRRLKNPKIWKFLEENKPDMYMWTGIERFDSERFWINGRPTYAPKFFNHTATV